MKFLSFALIYALASVTASASTVFHITGQTEDVLDGGQFSAWIGSPANSFAVECADFRNYEQPVADVNISTPISLAAISNTRYGTTPTANFSFFNAGAGALNALDRYVEAAWLTTQYDFSSGVTVADDRIQNAIWTLLTVNGTSGFPFGDVEGTGLYLTLAKSWETGAALGGTLAAFEGNVRIYTSTDVGACAVPGGLTALLACDRYSTGSQEMISVTPEPNAAWFAVAGLVFMAMARIRKKAR